MDNHIANVKMPQVMCDVITTINSYATRHTQSQSLTPMENHVANVKMPQVMCDVITVIMVIKSYATATGAHSKSLKCHETFKTFVYLSFLSLHIILPKARYLIPVNAIYKLLKLCTRPVVSTSIQNRFLKILKMLPIVKHNTRNICTLMNVFLILTPAAWTLLILF